MRYFISGIYIAICLFVFTDGVFAQNANGCSGGQRYGIYYTNCWADATDDTQRLQDAIDATDGKLVFNEVSYSISNPLTLHSYLIIEGLGNNPYSGNGYDTSRIVQTGSGDSIFLIGDGIYEVSIRDIALVAGSTGNVGILAHGGYSGHTASSLFFQFSNIRFSGLDKGIYVDADDGGWQFDNVRLDACSFDGNNIGVHVDSMNSGWSITGIDMGVPEDGIGFYFERSTYTSVSHVIGNGPSTLGNTPTADAFIKIVRHGNISIQNAVSEGFDKDLIIDGVNTSTRNFPIALINNHFMNGISVKDSTVMSTGNQFGYADATVGNHIAEVTATGDSVIYSVGDKFCFEGESCIKNSVNYNGYVTSGNAKVVTSIGGQRNSISLGREGYWYDIGRSETDGTLTFSSGTQGFGFTFNANYSNVTVKNGAINFNNGTITLGSTVFANINLGVNGNGTLYYCSDCQQTNPCASGGSGAIAKRINGAWVCN